ncbi:MAG: twitching motility protein [Frankiales bacterium]|nr:twitching motility protein [Frankiales bacterium]
MDVQDSSSQAPTDALSDDFFAAPAPAAESYALAPAAPVAPLEPAWSPAPGLSSTDPFDVAQPTMTFGAVPEAPVYAAAPEAVTVAAPLAPAEEALPAWTQAPAVPAQAESAPAVSAPLPSGDASPTATASATGSDEAVRLGAEDRSEDSGFLTDLLIETLDRGCSDLHLAVGAPPTVRSNGHLEPVEGRPILTPQGLQQVLYAILSQKQREKFEAEWELDFAYSVPGRARFRVNLYRQRDSIGAAFRLIPFEIKPLEVLGVPPSVSNFAMLPRGFVLVTGPTGSGKSTTLAAIVDLANRNRRDHIMTVEDPNELLHEHKSCLVNQREVGEDTHSFQNALKHVLRQDPDIILVGEMRDLETIEIALTAAETGHLVMATLHTQDAAQTIDRVIDVFPPHQQQQVRVQLAGTLQGVVCQQLVRTADGQGRVVATEVLIATPAIRNLIREGKTHQIYSAMQAGARHGMATMDQHLAELVKKNKITYDAALEKCHHVEDFQRLCGRT